ncbi:MAG TPA: TetR/AcrR family transcriptional regulator [Mycobacterium sp.]|nr:TetR/AcrR family transcriptional regulator [Mycobacterium sp.]
MTEQAYQTDRRADATRDQILRAASQRFAQRPYHEVGLDDILIEAGLTKGAMYFHFRSKHALALAIIEKQLGADNLMIQDLLNRKLSGLETLIDICYVMAVRDIGEEDARAVLNLLPAIGRTGGIRGRLVADWVKTLVMAAERAVAEGDVVQRCDPHDVAHALMSLYLGQRQSGNLDEPEQFLLGIEKDWKLILPGIVTPDRLAYFSQFVRRRTALAIRTTVTPVGSAATRSR